MAKEQNPKTVETLIHDEDRRKNIPTAEYQSMVEKETKDPIRVAYERRNRDLDPQLVWRGKDEQNWSDLVVTAPPLYIQEKLHPKVLIDDLLRRTAEDKKNADTQIDLFSDFNGLPSESAKTEFYQHDSHWTNRMILGDSLQVMASLAEREGLRGKVQCIYMDPPYGIKFNSNFQWSTTSRDVKDGNTDQITREPEQVKAFRDTWRDGIHSYMTYLRDRLTVAHDLLADTGSFFMQIGDENVHRVRALLDEIFNEDNFVSDIVFRKTSGQASNFIAGVYDHILWYTKNKEHAKYRSLFSILGDEVSDNSYNCIDDGDGTWHRLKKEEFIDKSKRRFRTANITSQGASAIGSAPFTYQNKVFEPSKGNHWKPSRDGLTRLGKSGRLIGVGNTLTYKRFLKDFPIAFYNNIWTDTIESTFSVEKVYVVQTGMKVIERCLLMASDPGDLILDPTCGSGTTAYVSEQWGRRWITIDTSRVALALARARIMGGRYPYYFLSDTPEGLAKEAEITGTIPLNKATHGSIRQGFVYERVPHITLKSIANNTEIDVIWDRYQAELEPVRQKLNAHLKTTYEEWEIPREEDSKWSSEAKEAHKKWWTLRIARQKEIDSSIAVKAEFEYLYDKPYEDKKKVRIAGPFTVESISPHRVLGIDENDDLIDESSEPEPGYGPVQDFTTMILENLKTAGVQQARKDDKIVFTSLSPWPGELICAEGRYIEEESKAEKRAAVFIGPEFGTVSRPDLVEAAREAGDSGFDVLITCAFNYDAHSTDFNKLGRIPVLKARMNADLHMADDLRNNGKGNLFVIFGEPDITISNVADNKIQVKVNGVDVFHPNTGEVCSDGPEGIACWFIDTDYNEESFFVRHAYFLGANDPYSSLKTTLKAEINAEAWATLNSDTSRPFEKPKSGRIAVKVINHLGDEVMKVFRV